jgi:hypothetical protein
VPLPDCLAQLSAPSRRARGAPVVPAGHDEVAACPDVEAAVVPAHAEQVIAVIRTQTSLRMVFMILRYERTCTTHGAARVEVEQCSAVVEHRLKLVPLTRAGATGVTRCVAIDRQGATGT